MRLPENQQFSNGTLIQTLYEWSKRVGVVVNRHAADLDQILSVRDLGDADGIGTITLNVPSEYATIQAAVDYLAPRRIQPGTTVRIKVSDGTYTLSAGLVLNHIDGEQIELVGNQSTPANCVITVSGAPTFDALTVSNGYSLGLLDGFKFNLSSKATSANNYTAILALNGGFIRTGANITVNNWYYPIAARVGASIYCRGVTVSNGGDVGIWAVWGGSIDCQGATVTDCSDSANTLGWGIEAEYGSAIDAMSATVSGCYRGGVGALSGSAIKFDSGISQSNTGAAGGAHGLFAENGGMISAHSAQTKNNTGFGIHRGTAAMGIVIGNSITNTGNSSGTDDTSVQMDVTGGQSRVLFYGPSGARIDNANGASIYLNTSGGAQLEVAHTASVNTRFTVTGGAAGTSDQPVLSASGTNTSMRYQAPGTGSHYFRTGGGLQTEIYNTASADTWVGLTGGVAGARVRALGATNADIRVTPRGTGQGICEESGGSIRFRWDSTGIGFHGSATLAKPTTGSGSATFTENAGTAVNDASTFDGYTLKQVVKALRDYGLLT